MNIVPTEAIAIKLVETVDCGLVSGLGCQIPGKMCVEAAVCYAFDLPHGDKPPCVGTAVREFKIKLNDCNWSSNMARAKGMKSLAVAQLGSDKLDQGIFGQKIFTISTQRLLPFVFRKVAADKNVKPEHATDYIRHAKMCEAVVDFNGAKTASASASASAYAYAPAYASASAPAYASAYAYAYASAYAYAYASAYAPAYASAYAYAYAWFRKNLGDELLNLTAGVGLEVLKKMESPGCKWLWLCD